MNRYMVYGEGPYENKLAWDEPPFNCKEVHHCYGVEAETVELDEWGGLHFCYYPREGFRCVAAGWAAGRWVWFGKVHGRGWPQDVVDIFWANSGEDR